MFYTPRQHERIPTEFHERASQCISSARFQTNSDAGPAAGCIIRSILFHETRIFAGRLVMAG
jgi:hypothetical protein